MTIKNGLLPVLTQVRKIKYGYDYDYDDLVEEMVGFSNTNQTKLAVRLINVMNKKDRNSETELIKCLFSHELQENVSR